MIEKGKKTLEASETQFQSQNQNLAKMASVNLSHRLPTIFPELKSVENQELLNKYLADKGYEEGFAEIARITLDPRAYSLIADAFRYHTAKQSAKNLSNKKTVKKVAPRIVKSGAGVTAKARNQPNNVNQQESADVNELLQFVHDPVNY